MNKVLIVDDHPVIRLAVRMLMERHGYEVVAETGSKGLFVCWIRELVLA